MSPHPHPHTLLGAYALDALGPQERAAFEDHLQECAACREEVRDLRAAASRLGAAGASAPPAGLRDRLLADVARTRQLPPVARVVPLRRPAWRRPSLLLAAAAAVFALAAGALGITAWRAEQRAADLAAYTARVSAVAAAEDALRARGPVAGGGMATVLASPSLGRTVVLADGLPPLEPSRAYQVWLIGPDAVRSGGMLPTDRGGDAMMLVEQSLAGVSSVGLSVEPAHGSPQPTTDPVLVLDLIEMPV